MHSEVTMTHRGLTLRVHPGSRAKHDKMMRTAGACRRVWNEALAIRKQKVQRKIAHGIKNWCHQTRRTIADIHDVVILAALNMQGMTQSARGSKDKPDTHVTQKRGLNRAMLRSGWGASGNGIWVTRPTQRR